ncbi:MAG: SufD family Fe-S cluster assembly protein, partial [Deltaproteobacteria bacterium]|nr:SufD family Fe-S cluster assembly protein [Deltaproteobacteria bacterium]
MRGLDEMALSARDKTAKLGPDIDLDVYGSEPVPHGYVEDLDALSEADKERMILAGVDAGETGRSGTYVQKDTSVIHAHSMQEGLEVIPIKEALKQYDWV